MKGKVVEKYLFSPSLLTLIQQETLLKDIFIKVQISCFYLDAPKVLIFPFNVHGSLMHI
jgi:hypothetical protein